MVQLYDLNGKTGIGFTLICEGMNSNLKEGSYWASFIDMKTKKVLFARRIVGAACGFGFEEYWLCPVHNIIQAMKTEFKTWE